jgi:hypothetical protein
MRAILLTLLALRDICYGRAQFNPKTRREEWQKQTGMAVMFAKTAARYLSLRPHWEAIGG